jgi:hypothetical protein
MKRAAIATSFAVLASAAPAHAATGTPYSLHAGPLPVHGYAMTVDASLGILTITFTRTAPGTSQSHVYSFSHVQVTGRRDIRRGRLTADLGRFGRLDLRFRPSGAIHKRKLGPGCIGTEPDRHRIGRVTGTFRLVADTTFFGTVTASRLPADLTRAGNSICRSTGTAPEFPGPLTLANDGGPVSTSLLVVALKGGRSYQDVTVDAGHVLHEITSTGPAGSFTGSTQAATVHGAPGFSGTLAYTATKRKDAFDTTGTLNGDYTALFDSIAPVTFPAGTKAQVSGPS